MSHFAFEVLRVLAATKPENGCAIKGAVPSALSVSRAMWMARVATTLAVVLLWFAGELERFAQGDLPLGESVPAQTQSREEEDEASEQESASEGVTVPASFDSSEPLHCRWCLQKVVCRPGEGMLNPDGSAHECGSFSASRNRKKMRNSAEHPSKTLPPSRKLPLLDESEGG